jgi:hypothetical protein
MSIQCCSLYVRASQEACEAPGNVKAETALPACSNVLLIIALGDDGEPAAYEVLPPEPRSEPLVSPCPAKSLFQGS